MAKLRAYPSGRQTEVRLITGNELYSATLAAVRDAADKEADWVVPLLAFLTLTLNVMVFLAAL